MAREGTGRPPSYPEAKKMELPAPLADPDMEIWECFHVLNVSSTVLVLFTELSCISKNRLVAFDGWVYIMKLYQNLYYFGLMIT